MKDYSKFFKYPEVFVTNIESNNKSIKLTLRNDDVVEYPLTRENINKFYNRLQEQYIKVVNHMNKVSNNRKTFPLILLTLILAITSYFGYSYQYETLATILTFGGVVSLAGACTNELIIKPNNKEKLSVYKDFLEHMDEFSKAIEKDSNILSVSKDTSKVLEQEKKLQSEGLIDDSININFMDKAKLEDLKLMSKRLKIYQELNLPVIFIGDKHKNEDIKVRTKNNKK